MIRLNFKYTLLTCFLASLFAYSQADAQTVFWSDNFDTPAGGANNNNAGAGWLGSTNTPGGGQNTSFIGYSNSWIVGSDGGACVSGNKLYIKAFGSSNAYISDVYTDKLNATPSISTVGYTGISLGFTWRCDGVANTDYGLVGLSSDNGATWNWLPTKYSGQESCITATIPIPVEYQGIATFKVAFRFISNATSCSTCDPPFNIDNITLTGTGGATCTPPTVSAGSAASICAGASATIGGSPTATGGSESGAYVYTWTPSTGLSNASSANPVASPTATTVYTVSVHKGTASCAATSTVTVTVNPAQTLTATPAGPLTICPGQTSSLTASAGFTNYVWTIPGGSTVSGATITASNIGTYSVIATGSNTCPSTTATVVINAGAGSAIAVTPSGPTTFCSGQNVTLNAAAGFTNYLWSNGSTGQSLNVTASGNYSVVAEGGACGGYSTPIAVTVNQPAVLGLTPSGNAAICPNQPLTLNAQAGFTNYVWSNGGSGASIVVSSAGSFGVSATDGNGCTVQSSFTNVTQSAPFTIGVNPSGTVDLCSGQSITLTAQSGFNTYLWSNNTSGPTLTVTSPGAYSVSANNAGGCSGTSDAIFVNLTPSPVAGFTSIQIDNPIYSVQFTSSQTADSYLWDFGSGATSTSASPTHAFPFDGTYPVTLTITNACGSNTITTNVVVLKTGIESLSSIEQLEILPGANEGVIVVKGAAKSQKQLVINVLSLTGQVVGSQIVDVNGTFSQHLQLSSSAKGIYLITISDGNEQMTRKWFN